MDVFVLLSDLFDLIVSKCQFSFNYYFYIF